MKLLLLILCLVPSLCFAGKFDDDIIFVSKDYLHVREKTNANDHPEIDRWLKFVGLDNKGEYKRSGQGYSYCMAYVCTMIADTYKYHNEPTPFYKMAKCSDVWTLSKKNKYKYKTFTAKQVFIGAEKLSLADVVIFSHNKASNTNFSGHTGLVLEQLDNNTFKAIEGNTVGSDSVLDDREQNRKSKNVGGVFVKKRKLGLGTTAFPVEGFIRIREDN